MGTKANIKAKMISVYTGNSDVTEWDEVESTLHTDTASILENIYMTPVSEVSSGTHVITTPNANFSYTATITKIGRHITIDGALLVLGSGILPIGSKILEIDIAQTEYLGDGIAYSVATNGSNAQSIGLRMNGNNLETNASVSNNERFKFSITYKALN